MRRKYKQGFSLAVLRLDGYVLGPICRLYVSERRLWLGRPLESGATVSGTDASVFGNHR